MVNQRQKGIPFCFLRYKHRYRKDTFAKAHSSLAALYGNIIPYPSVEWQGFPWICLDIFCVLSWIHALILYFSDINAPVSVPGGERHRGCGALDKVGRDCYHKSRKSAVTSGWLSVSANNNIMLTVQLPLGGQHAFMESASAKNTTHSRNFKKNLSIPASPPSNVDFARG